MVDVAVNDVAVTVFEIVTGTVVLAPESKPVIVKVVVNVLLAPNKVVLLIALKETDWPLTVWLNLSPVKGILLIPVALAPVPTKLVSNLLSAMVNK